MRPRHWILLAAIAVSLVGLLASLNPIAQTATSYQMAYALSPDRAVPQSLDGATVSGVIYPFTSPDEDVDDVTFSLDGQVVWTEDNPPFDFAGGSARHAKPWDTTRVADGEHTITATMLLLDGGQLQISATFIVANTAPAPPPAEPTATPTNEPAVPTDPGAGTYSLVYSLNADHGAPQSLDGATVSGVIYPFTTPDDGVQRVRFFLDGTLVQQERNAPFDFMGGDANRGNPWDTTAVADGQHTITAEMSLNNGTTYNAVATFTVGNAAPPDEPGDPTPTPTATEPESDPDHPDAYDVVYSTSATRDAATILESATLSGTVYVFITPDTNVDEVRFSLDGTLVSTELDPPFDLMGTDGSQAYPWDTIQVADGSHTVTAEVRLDDGATHTISATFMVSNTEEPPDEPSPDPPSPGDPSSNQARLVDSYVVHVQATGYDEFKYRPRQFTNGLIAPSHKGDKQVTDAGAYNGWDVLITRNTGGARVQSDNPWFTVRLTRAAQVAIVWQDKDAPPNWLASWPKAGTVSIGGDQKQVYLKTFNAGDFSLGSVWNGSGNGPYGRETYLVLFAESNGQPTPAPAVPAGKSAVQPNETCPTWVHDQYVTQGPDGRTYATWHPQIDPVYWCYFRHDHGSNPANFGDGSYEPAFGYAAHHHGMTEPHAGFKVFVGDYQGYGEFLFVVHMGSGGTARYCARFHTVDFALWNGSKIVAETYFLADFGKSVINRTNDPKHHTPFTPVSCPNQADVGDSVGERHLPAASHDGLQIGYEGWRFDVSKSPMLGLQGGTVTFWTQDGMTICNDVNCAQTIAVPGNNDADHQIQDFFRFEVVSPSHAGTFYTDPHGTTLLNSGDPHAVKQYVAPGINLTNWNSVEKCRDLDGWGRQLTCHVDNPRDGNDEREGSLDLSYYGSVPYLK